MPIQRLLPLDFVHHLSHVHLYLSPVLGEAVKTFCASPASLAYVSAIARGTTIRIERL